MKNALSIVALFLVGFTHSQLVRAADDGATEVEKLDSVEETAETQPKWESTLKSKYSLTDAQIQSMRAAGLKGPQIATTAELSKASGKSIEEVTKMRTESKMGWGKIAKELGVNRYERIIDFDQAIWSFPT